MPLHFQLLDVVISANVPLEILGYPSFDGGFSP